MACVTLNYITQKRCFIYHIFSLSIYLVNKLMLYTFMIQSILLSFNRLIKPLICIFSRIYNINKFLFN